MGIGEPSAIATVTPHTSNHDLTNIKLASHTSGYAQRMLFYMNRARHTALG
jgi:hypothetical protein